MTQINNSQVWCWAREGVFKLSCLVHVWGHLSSFRSICSPFTGVGIGVVHAGYERRLAHHLGAHSTPSILGLINGKITFFHSAVVRENLRQFVENLLPGNLVEKVHVRGLQSTPVAV